MPVKGQHGRRYRLWERLLALYDAPDPERPGLTIPGYDKEHAERATRLVLRVARRLGVDATLLPKLEVTALLHDIGRAGMNPQLFGIIFESAQAAGLPVRVTELAACYPQVGKDGAAAFYVELVRPVLAAKGLAVDERVRDHIDMRMAFAQRLRCILQQRQAELERLGITVEPWMEQVMLYYYYPEKMEGAPEQVRLMGEVLVACENFEAFNNQRRGRDYYGRRRESMREAVQVLRRFLEQGLISRLVYGAVLQLAAAGEFDDVVRESRGLAPDAPLPPEDRAFLTALASDLSSP